MSRFNHITKKIEMASIMPNTDSSLKLVTSKIIRHRSLMPDLFTLSTGYK